MKKPTTINCQHIINNKTCNNPRETTTPNRTKYCISCVKLRKNITTKIWWRKSGKVFKPNIVNCKLESCGKIIERNSRYQNTKVYCNYVCRKTHYKLIQKKLIKSKIIPKPYIENETEKTLTIIKCMGCGRKEKRMIHRDGDYAKKTKMFPDGRILYKRCQGCQSMAGLLNSAVGKLAVLM